MIGRARALLTACGLWGIAVTAAAPASGQVGLDFAGVHAGALLSAGGNAETLVGGQAGFRWTRTFSVVSSLDLRPDFPDDPTKSWSGTAVWGFATLRARAPWPMAFLSVGLGVAVGHASATNSGRNLSLGETSVGEVVVASLSVRIWRLRPFVDLHLIHALLTPTEPRSHLTAGISLTRSQSHE